MPGYKRIVSYIYAYDKGERKENVGFVKSETWNEECRFAIQMRGTYAHGQVPHKAYLYAPREDYLLGVFLGELENKNGVLEWKGGLEAEDLKRMPYSLKDAKGIWIEGSGGKRYASEWEDYPVKVDSFRIYEETQETSFEEALAEQSYEVQGIEAIQSTEEARQGAGEEIQVQKEIEQQAGEEPQQQEQTDQPPEPSALQSAQIENELQEQEEKPLEPRMVKRDSRQEKWEYLTRRFPVQKLFQNGRAPMSCIRIGPRDLQRLPRGNWILGNNSFLLHGYYQYRHLLLCRQEEGGKAEYYLAVPGVYNDREKMMADLFGFEEFRRSRNTGNRGGNYGYWFRRIEEAPEEA